MAVCDVLEATHNALERRISSRHQHSDQSFAALTVAVAVHGLRFLDFGHRALSPGMFKFSLLIHKRLRSRHEASRDLSATEELLVYYSQ